MECWTCQPEGPPGCLGFMPSSVIAPSILRAATSAAQTVNPPPRMERRFDGSIPPRGPRACPTYRKEPTGASGDYREVITLKIWGELTFAQIGESLGIPANTAASRYRYAMTELRRLTKEVLA